MCASDPLPNAAAVLPGRDRLSAVLDALGWPHEFREDDVCVARPDECGIHLVLMSPSADFENLTSLMFRSGWRRSDVTLTMINTFNYRYRFVRAYLDAEDDPVLQMDLLIDGTGDPMLPRALRKFFTVVLTFEGFLGAFEGLVGSGSPPPN